MGKDGTERGEFEEDERYRIEYEGEHERGGMKGIG